LFINKKKLLRMRDLDVIQLNHRYILTALEPGETWRRIEEPILLELPAQHRIEYILCEVKDSVSAAVV